MKAKIWVSEKISERRKIFKMCGQAEDLAQPIECLLNMHKTLAQSLAFHIIGSGGPHI